MRLFFRQATRRIAAVTIGAAEHDMLGFVHWLDAFVTFQTANAFCVRFGLRLIDPGALGERRTRDCRFCDRNGRWRAVAGSCFLRDCRARYTKEQQQKTFNAQRPTLNVQLWSSRPHFEFFSAVRMLAEKILINSSVSLRSAVIRFSGSNSRRAIK